MALSIAALLWISWCFLVVTALVPAVLRKLTIYPGLTAWVLCVSPVVLGGVVLISRTSDEQQ